MNPCLYRRMAALAALVLLLSGEGMAGAGKDGGDADQKPDLSLMSLEELTQIKVSSAGRREQEMSRVAAAVFVITHEDIRASGLTSIPELLRRVPGLQVGRIDSSKWAVSSRGFNGRFSNKMLVMIDGRSIYNTLYSGVYWDQYDIPLDEIERIEVIRGPGGTMWGANAVNGVINIITKKAKESRGGLLVADAGQELLAGAMVNYAGQRGDTLQYRGYSKFAQFGSMFPSTGADGVDRWRSLRAGGRLDWQASNRDSFTFLGDAYRGRGDQQINSVYPNPMAVTANDVARWDGGFGQARWGRIFKRSDIALQGYFNQENRNELFASDRMSTIDLDFQQHFVLGKRHEVIWGAGYRRMHDQLMDGADTTSAALTAVSFSPNSRTDNLYSTFVEEDFSLIPDKLVVTAGSKFQHNGYTGFEVSPSGRLLWTPNSKNTIWGAVSRAVRTPSRRDSDIRMAFEISGLAPFPVVGVLSGDPRYKAETAATHEGGYRSQPTKRLTLDIAGFVTRYRNLQSVEVGQPTITTAGGFRMFLPIQFRNGYDGTTYGVETALWFNVTRSWKLQASHTWMVPKFHQNSTRTYLDAPGDTWISPRHTASVQSILDLRWHLSLTTALYGSSRLWCSAGLAPDPTKSDLLGRSLPTYVRADVHLSWKAGELTEISGGITNLQDNAHVDFTPNDYTYPFQIRRTAYIQLRRRF